jgi:hypothetical protein
LPPCLLVVSCALFILGVIYRTNVPGAVASPSVFVFRLRSFRFKIRYSLFVIFVYSVVFIIIRYY